MSRKAYRSTDDVQSLIVGPVTQSIKRHLSASVGAFTLEDLQRSLNDFKAENGQSFSFQPVPNHLGGSRWLFLCPGCGRCCTKLFLPSQSDEYRCAKCHRVKSPSALYGRSSVYLEVLKPVKEMARIMDRLRGGRLSEEEAQALIRKHEGLRQSVHSSPAYSRYLQKMSAARIPS